MNKNLINEFEKILKITSEHGFTLDAEKEIPYGLSLKFYKNDEISGVNIYFSKKKGISHVISGKKKNKTTEELRQIIGMSKVERKHSWEKWLGTDESGKGDFFGPLVVAGFLCTSDIEKDLVRLGIKDSKRIKDKKIIELTKIIYSRYNENIEVVYLKPETYNKMYKKFRNQGKKLNELLAWMHARVILNFDAKHKFEGAVVDKFASDKTMKNSLKGMKNIKLEHFVRAESDVAVATASVIARYHFLQFIEQISKKFKIDFHKGASNLVIEDAQKFANTYNIERMNEVAKLHFKTFDKIK